MDSDYLFCIFKHLLHIKSKELLAQAYATLAKFDNTLTSHLCFPDPKYLFLLLLTLSVSSEGYCGVKMKKNVNGDGQQFFRYQKSEQSHQKPQII
jgi:hypothetical protein